MASQGPDERRTITIQGCADNLVPREFIFRLQALTSTPDGQELQSGDRVEIVGPITIWDEETKSWEVYRQFS